MRMLIAATAVLLASSAAQAGDSYSFDIGGRTIHIDRPSNCDSASCVSVSIPGVYEFGPKRRKAKTTPSDEDRPAQQTSREPAQPSTAARNDGTMSRESKAPGTASRGDQSLEPANGTAQAAAPTASPPPPTASAAPAADPASSAAARPSSTGLAPPVVASAPAAGPGVVPAEPTPIGIWLTEEKEGQVRIEPCGQNLCGYSVGKNEKILINMKPTGAKWSGRIHDPKSGSDYDSTIALRGSDKLRVQGCAFGGMFCGGQTWTRIN